MAAGLPALVVLLLAGLGVVTGAGTKLACLDAAREGAVAAARGEDGVAAATRVAPDGARISISTASGGLIVLTVEAEVHLIPISVRATATAAQEPGGLP